MSVNFRITTTNDINNNFWEQKQQSFKWRALIKLIQVDASVMYSFSAVLRIHSSYQISAKKIFFVLLFSGQTIKEECLREIKIIEALYLQPEERQRKIDRNVYNKSGYSWWKSKKSGSNFFSTFSAVKRLEKRWFFCTLHSTWSHLLAFSCSCINIENRLK